MNTVTKMKQSFLNVILAKNSNNYVILHTEIKCKGELKRIKKYYNNY